MGNSEINIWRKGKTRQLTFVVTQDCNLRCKYCYMVGKNNRHRMSPQTAHDIVDYFFFGKEDIINAEYVVLDFIGGESLLELELIDETVDYFRLKAYKTNSKWFDRFRIMIQSNGILVGTAEFKRFMEKNKGIVSLGITIDGTKRKHDMQRVFPDGKGSYDIVEKNYMYAFSKGWTNSTKVTFGHEDLPYLCESIVHLWNLGIKTVPANIVYENVWLDGDPEIFESQLIKLADYVIDKHLWNEVNTTLFSDNLGFKAPMDSLEHPVCGTGSMFCVDDKGDIYNCVRFLDYSLNEKRGKSYGNVYTGIDKEKVRALRLILPKYMNPEKCKECHVSMGCSFCSGNNYDESDIGTVFHRSMAICDMHQARVRGNNYYWARLENEYNIQRESELCPEYYMYVLLDHNSVRYCDYDIEEGTGLIDPQILISYLEYAFKNFYVPVFVHSDESTTYLQRLLLNKTYGAKLSNLLRRVVVKNIVLYKNKHSHMSNAIFVVNKDSEEIAEHIENVILEIDEKSVGTIASKIESIIRNVDRINLVILGLDDGFDFQEYKRQLNMVAEVLQQYYRQGIYKEVRQITDAIFVDSKNNCFAGERNFTVGPDGNKYLCPAFYYKGLLKNPSDEAIKLSKASNSPLCNECNVSQCDRCVYCNYMHTSELCIPPAFQCKKGRIEREVSKALRRKMIEEKILDIDSCVKLKGKSIDPFKKYDYDISHPLWDGAK